MQCVPQRPAIRLICEDVWAVTAHHLVQAITNEIQYVSNGRGCIASPWQLREKFLIKRRLFPKTPRQGEIEGLGIHSVRALVVRALYCSIWAARTHAKRNNCVVASAASGHTHTLLPRQLTASSSSCEKGACNQGKRLDDSVGGTTTSSSRSDSSSTSCAMLLAYHTATRMPSIASPVCALQRQHLYFILPVKQVN